MNRGVGSTVPLVAIVDVVDRVVAPGIAVDLVAVRALVARVAVREDDLRAERLDRILELDVEIIECERQALDLRRLVDDAGGGRRIGGCSRTDRRRRGGSVELDDDRSAPRAVVHRVRGVAAVCRVEVELDRLR